MSDFNDLLLNGVLAIVGLLGGLAISHFYYRRGGAARPRLTISLEEKARIDPATVGVQIEMKVGKIKVANLVVLDVVVRNPSYRDLAARNPTDPEQHPQRPRIELPAGLRALADPWNPEGALPRADVRVARQIREERQVFYLHMHRLASRTTVTTRILCTSPDSQSAPPLRPADLAFFLGYEPNIDVRAEGLLKQAPKLER